MGRRKYEQTVRSENQEQTRQRIVRAALDLHSERGPAATSLSAVAERAGVQRNTLYRHFPDERALFLACSGLHIDESPLPDPAAWLGIPSAIERASVALRALFDYFEQNQAIVAHVFRDAEDSPLIREITELRFGAPMGAIMESVLTAWPSRERTKKRKATVALALSFHTWQVLVRDGGLTNAEAASLMAATIDSA